MVECPKFILRRHIQWRKIIYLILIILRFITFIIFLAFIDFSKKEQIPTLPLILYVIINWRFLLIAGILSFYLLILCCETKKEKKSKKFEQSDLKDLVKFLWNFFLGISRFAMLLPI